VAGSRRRARSGQWYGAGAGGQGRR
jgi:hypothetical protein